MTNPKLPPVVIMPEKSRHRRASALSIIEHEIVHINQILAGASPELPKKRDVRTRIKYFADAMRTEYEANLLQLVRWPALYPTDVGLSLDHWCMLRGYADALEATVRLAARDNLTQTQAIRLVEGLETELHTGARRLGIDKAQLQWFVDRWPAHTATAITRVAAEFPIVKSTIAFAAIVSWWKARWGTASATVHEAVPAEHAPSRRHAPRSSKGRRAPAR